MKLKWCFNWTQNIWTDFKNSKCFFFAKILHEKSSKLEYWFYDDQLFENTISFILKFSVKIQKTPLKIGMFQNKKNEEKMVWFFQVKKMVFLLIFDLFGNWFTRKLPFHSLMVLDSFYRLGSVEAYIWVECPTIFSESLPKNSIYSLFDGIISTYQFVLVQILVKSIVPE